MMEKYHANTSSRSGHVSRSLILFLIVAATLILVFLTTMSGSENLAVFLKQHNQATHVTECGSSPSEARSRGCHFDVMSFSWLPTPCHDKELAEEFLSLRQWEWFATLPADNNQTDTFEDQHRDGRDEVPTAVPLEVVQQGENERLYVTWRYHLYHCTYMWRKLHRAMQKGSPVDGYIGEYAHTEHCERMLLREVEVRLESVDTAIDVKFPTCV